MCSQIHQPDRSMVRTESNNNVGFIKAIACILIVISHCIPIAESEVVNFYYGQWFFRFCVPFFFISTGYFYSKMPFAKRRSYLIRIAAIYCLATAIYFPYILETEKGILDIIKALILGYRHLWYLIALLGGLVIFEATDRVLSKRIRYILSAFLLMIGIVFDEYYKPIPYDNLSNMALLFKHLTRNGLFFAFPMLTIGYAISTNIKCIHRIKCSILSTVTIILFLLSFAETSLLRMIIGNSITLDLSLFGWTTAIPLFCIAINTGNNLSERFRRDIRKITDVVYIIHIIVLETLVSMNFISAGFQRAVICVFTSCILAILIIIIYKLFKALLNARR